MKKWTLYFILALRVLGYSQTNNIVRGPFLQQTGPVSTYICWKTSAPCYSKVLYGTSKSNLPGISYTSNTDTNHYTLLSGLSPDTKYYYIVNEDNVQMASDTFYFYTAPPVGSGKKLRFLALGDCGSGYVQQYNVRNAISFYNQDQYVNGILLLGDNAYNGGFQSEYQTGFFDPFKTNFLLNYSCIYPSPGNHDYANDYTLALSHQIPYYDIFKIPQNAELGGVPSNHKEFYSFNYGNAHFISLDSYGIEQGMYHLWDSLGPQYEWLEQDLVQDKSMWKIVYFHHPPFTMGSHNSDWESDLVMIRKKIARLLEKYGVDMVINGHSHNYERSWLQKGHYGLEATFNKTIHAVDSSTARYDGTSNSCPYKKDTLDNKGTVYVVAGESGKLGAVQSSYPHNSKCFSDSYKAGALFFEIEGNRLDAFYLEEDSLIHDKFTILKNVNRNQSIEIYSNQPVTISASWNGDYTWDFNNSHSKSQSIITSFTNQYIVHDSLNCLADTFNLIIPGIREHNTDNHLKVYPNPIKERLFLNYLNLSQESHFTIQDVSGKIFLNSKTHFINGNAEVSLSNLSLVSGTYFITLKISEKTVSKAFFIDR
ncbi:MAG: metallophosphoesterase [Bacteroidota bacterium]|jgi:hypothetical protein|nr:metallophosphoesterase [Bacteroidota bacterium]